MKLSIGTVAPPVTIVATAVGLLYFYLDAPLPAAAPKPIKLEVTDAILSPKFVPLPERNPFRLSKEAELKAQSFASVAPIAVKPPPTVKEQAAIETKKAKAKAEELPPSRRLDNLSSQLRRWTETLKKRAEAARLVQVDLKAKVDGKANLSCTSIHSRRKVAILNGRAYSEGEAIDWATGIAGPIVVAEVRAASVLLRSRGAEHEVLFPHSSKPTAAMPTATAAVAKKSKYAKKAAGNPATKAR